MAGMRLGGAALRWVMDVMGESLPLAVLDFVGIEHGESASASVAGAVGIAQAAANSTIASLSSLAKASTDMAEYGVPPSVRGVNSRR